MTLFVGRGSDEARSFVVAILEKEATAELVKLPKMLRKIPILYRDKGWVLKSLLMLDDDDDNNGWIDSEPDAMLLYQMSPIVWGPPDIDRSQSAECLK